MSKKIFFSWQADTPTSVGRNFVQKALTLAINEFRIPEGLDIAPAEREAAFHIDHDTLGLSGTPPIVESIFGKIDASVIFLADLTFVGRRLDGRPTPNPNVLLEYGYALKSKGYPRVLALMNEAHGVPSDANLPFNMKHLRWPLTYNLSESADGAAREVARAGLVGKLKASLLAVIESEEFKASLPKQPEPVKFSEKPPADGLARFAKRDEVIGAIEAPSFNQTPYRVRLSGSPALWLRVMPEHQQTREWDVSELRNVLSDTRPMLMPIGDFNGSSLIRAAGGYGRIPSMSSYDEPTSAVVLVFRSGEIWHVYAGPRASHNDLPNLEPAFTQAFLQSVALLKDGLKVEPPYRWIAGIEALMGKRLYKFPPPGQHYLEPRTGESLEDEVSVKGVFSGETAPALALTPFYGRLHDAFGSSRGEHYDAELLRLFNS